MQMVHITSFKGWQGITGRQTQVSMAGNDIKIEILSK